ncbi:MAG: hypothetical protein CMF31_09925 [Kordiimonas sp.]|nr:hypothetical protein [Kordiimonas sp.]
MSINGDKQGQNSPDAPENVPSNAASKPARQHRSRRRHAAHVGKNNRRGRWTHVYSALDLGTNNCRLLVAKPTSNGFRVIDAFSRIVRLGEGVSSRGALSEDAIERTIEALKVCAQKMERRGVTHMRNVATQACRSAENCDDFIQRVQQEARINIDIINPSEEARLAVIGCKALMDSKCKKAIVFDIGGGSTELIWTEIRPNGNPHILGWTSLPFGVVNLSEQYGGTDMVSPENYAAMVAIIKERLTLFEAEHNMTAEIKKGNVQMLGTSGTVTTLTSLYLQLPRYDRRQVDGTWVEASRLHNLCTDLSRMSYAERAAETCVGEDRAELVVAGCAILDAIMELWPVERIRVADRGIREGLLLELMDEHHFKRPHKNAKKSTRTNSSRHRRSRNRTSKDKNQKTAPFTSQDQNIIVA